MNRRGFLGTLLRVTVTAAYDPERALWGPGKKLISIPPPRFKWSGRFPVKLRPGVDRYEIPAGMIKAVVEPVVLRNPDASAIWINLMLNRLDYPTYAELHDQRYSFMGRPHCYFNGPPDIATQQLFVYPPPADYGKLSVEFWPDEVEQGRRQPAPITMEF